MKTKIISKIQNQMKPFLNQGQYINGIQFHNQIDESNYKIKTTQKQINNETIIYPYNFSLINNIQIAQNKNLSNTKNIT